MKIVRSIGGVLAGFAFSFVFGSLTSYLTVYYLHVTYSTPGPGYLVLTSMFAMGFAMLSGYITGLIAGRQYLLHSLVVSALLLASVWMFLPHTAGANAVLIQILLQHLFTTLFRGLGALLAGYQQNTRFVP